MTHVLYVYAVARAEHPLPEGAEAVDGGARIDCFQDGQLCAFHTPVSAEEFSQEGIDRRAGDIEWLGAIGYRHQNVMAALMRGGTIVPLRAFTLFRSESSLHEWLRGEREQLTKTLERLDGKQEWTLRIELDPQKWSDALVGRVEALRALAAEIETAGAGKAFLLRKKLDEARRQASREAEQQLVAEVEREVLERMACESVAESRERREGAFPQINVLINRDEESRLQELRDELAQRYESEGVTLALTGPWPPYTFAGTMNDER
ncbi:MAG TPA: GvpL/GvpF family gas vesicle protein [Thermoanaerobaculia bacterium]|nr:GvpL/GvpF family gas vesicle protein [Thermoanaerobaculia bacterium]